jgi:hypothetical protein
MPLLDHSQVVTGKTAFLSRSLAVSIDGGAWERVKLYQEALRHALDRIHQPLDVSLGVRRRSTGLI